MTKRPNKRQRARLDRLVAYVCENSEQPNFECVTVTVGDRGLFHRKTVALALKLDLLDWNWMDVSAYGLRLKRQA
jgi:hypothetical protein